jgi:hypothetical protein
LIQLAEAHPEWALGYEDETWFSRFERPSLHSWAVPQSQRIFWRRRREKTTPSRRPSLATGWMYLPELEQSWLKFVAGRPVSAITTQFLEWCCEKLEQRGKKALLLIWDNASWHKCHQVRNWIAAHNREVKDDGCGVRIVPCLLPKKSPWLNLIEPKWIHGKRKVVAPEGVLGADERADRVCGAFGGIHEPHIHPPGGR